MQLYKFTIEGFRKISKAEILLGNTTFLLGGNNCGKSTILKALDILLNSEMKQKLLQNDFHALQEDGQFKLLSNTVVLTGEFRDVPNDYRARRGFQGRVYSYTPNDEESGNSIKFRKVFEVGKEVRVEILSKKRAIKALGTFGDLLNVGLTEDLIKETLAIETVDQSAKLTATQRKKFEDFDEVYDIQDEDVWDVNPGGLLPVFMSNLPKYVEIPALHSLNELEGKTGAMQKILTTLFEEVREKSENYQQANSYLTKLSAELNPKDESKDFGKLLKDLNQGFGGVFPGARLNISVDLSDPNTAIQPSFLVQAASNVQTPISYQGTGLSRSALFSLLKFRAEWLEKRAGTDKSPRKIIIGFEEPELYLHPSAAILARDFIYDLGITKSVQILCTTHSTSMIDLSREKSAQVINHLYSQSKDVGGHQAEEIFSNAFNIDQGFKDLHQDDKVYVKMIVRIDDQLTKSFFTERCVFFEGDSEQIAFMETIKRMPEERRRKLLSKYTLVNARGKATLISLIKYAKALGIKMSVVHDSDTGTAGAEKFNEPIKAALDDDSALHVLNGCLEDHLGIGRATSEKPYKIYKHVNEWPKTYEELPKAWVELVDKVFS